MACDLGGMNDTDVLKAYRYAVVHYWERARWLYLALLALATVLGSFLGGTRAHAFADEALFDLGSLILLAFLFVAANACYSVVYLLEFLVMGTRVQEIFHHYRWLLLGAGCLLGSALAYGISYEISRTISGGF